MVDVPSAWGGVLDAALLRLSAEGNDSERCLAVKALQARGGGGAIETLTHLLRDPDPDVRADAAQALGTTGVGDDGARILIENLIEDPIGENKVHYIRTLASLNVDGIATLFLELVTGRGEAVVWEDYDGGWDDWLDVQTACLDVLPDVIPDADWGRAVEAVLAALSDEEGQDLTAMAYRVLARLGTHGADALSLLLPTASRLQRKRIAKALADARGTDVASMLETLLGDEDTEVRIAALMSAAGLGLTDLCAQGFQDSAPEVRVAAVEAASWDDRTTLKKALRDISPVVRKAACQRIADLGRKMPGMGLTTSIQKNLRSGNASMIAGLIGAACVAEPNEVGEVLEDIVNHKASALEVRCAALRGLGRLQTGQAATLCTEAVSHSERAIRAEAVHALGQIAASGGKQADTARGTLVAAIAGSLVRTPEDWEPDHNKVISMPPRKGAQAAGDEGDAKIRIDREGNIVEVPPEGAADGEMPLDANEDEEVAIAVDTAEGAPATSTLAAILSFEPTPAMTEDAIELEDEDLDLLEMASGGARKRKIDPQASEPAHIDVRRFAVRAALGHPHSDYIDALCIAAEDHDATLAAGALDALGALRKAGLSIIEAEQTLLRLAGWTNPDVKARAVAQLGAIEGEASAACLAECLQPETDPYTLSAAVGAAAERSDIEMDIKAYVTHVHARVRSTAAAIVATDMSEDDAVPILLCFARTGHTDHHIEAARLLSGMESAAAPEIANWIDGDDPQLRHKAIEMIGVMWSNDTADPTRSVNSIQ